MKDDANWCEKRSTVRARTYPPPSRCPSPPLPQGRRFPPPPGGRNSLNQISVRGVCSTVHDGGLHPASCLRYTVGTAMHRASQSYVA